MTTAKATRTTSTVSNSSRESSSSSPLPLRFAQVGSIVRAPRRRCGDGGAPNDKKQRSMTTGRAIVALNDNHDDNGSVLILWQDLVAQPFSFKTGANNIDIVSRFVVTPMVPKDEDNVQYDEREELVGLSDLKPLLEFEQRAEQGQLVADTSGTTTDISLSVWKERGDALLRVGDASSAIPYYEAGLMMASRKIQVGSTGLVFFSLSKHQHRAGRNNNKGEEQCKCLVVEVDYLEDDDKTADVTVILGNDDDDDDTKECTICQSDILLCFLPGDEEMMQVKILLNLTRCLMQVADLDAFPRKVSACYRRSAVKACTMALAMLEHEAARVVDDGRATGITTNPNDRKQDQHEATKHAEASSSSLHAKALLLRSKAHASLSKYKFAMADAQSLTRNHPTYKEGRKWASQLELQIAQTRKTNQRLAKRMCKWVQTATTGATAGTDETSAGGEKIDKKQTTLPPSESVSRTNHAAASAVVTHHVDETSPPPPRELKRSVSFLTLLWYALFPLLLAALVHRFISAKP